MNGRSLLAAARRALRRLRHRRTAALAWKAEFHELPASARACRHQLTGEAPDRVCDEGFDCRACPEHEPLQARRERQAPAAAQVVGFDPRHRFYHRGHTWARLEKNGTVTIGVDGIARRVLGMPDDVELPQAGTRLEANGPLCRIRTRGRTVRLLSPIDGTVAGSRGAGLGFKLRVRPRDLIDLRHLLAGPEAKLWSLRELERLQRIVGTVASGTALADGGELLPDLGAVLAPERYDALVREVFLLA